MDRHSRLPSSHQPAEEVLVSARRRLPLEAHACSDVRTRTGRVSADNTASRATSRAAHRPCDDRGRFVPDWWVPSGKPTGGPAPRRRAWARCRDRAPGMRVPKVQSSVGWTFFRPAKSLAFDTAQRCARIVIYLPCRPTGHSARPGFRPARRSFERSSSKATLSSPSVRRGRWPRGNHRPADHVGATGRGPAREESRPRKGRM